MATENYMQKPLLFKLKKVARYVELYGIGRTLIKVRGQMHMAATDTFEGTRWDNPGCKNPDAPSRKVGFIGSGAFPFGNLAYYVTKEDKHAIRGAMDIDAPRARSLVERYGAAYATTNAEDIINDPQIELIYIASNHATHATYAVDAIRAGKHVHIEKPQVVSAEQLDALTAAMRDHPEVHVFLGYNRPRSTLFARLREELDKQSGASMVNWFVAGHAINEDHWYFKDSEGGRILGNLCHWSDLTLELVGMENVFPLRITPTSAANAASDFVTGIEFGDRSLAGITFSAKGHTFEGVRETLNLHKGDVLATLSDFKTLKMDIGDKRVFVNRQRRDHGHRANVVNSFNVLNGGPSQRVDIDYNIVTSKLFLAIAAAHKHNTEIHLETIDSPIVPAL